MAVALPPTAPAAPLEASAPQMLPPAPAAFESSPSTQPGAVYDQPRARPLWFLGAAGLAAVVTALVFSFRPTPNPLGADATLDITLDIPAMISVDGTEQAIGQRATVPVKAGVEHVVTVARAGNVVRTLHVPGLKPNERMPLSVNIR
jgi:hypothetical protein